MAASIPTDPKHYLALAELHLQRVQDASVVEDWTNLGTYGLYCLEALVRAAALKSGETPIRNHWGKADQARNLAGKHGLPDIFDLLSELNVVRKAFAYGEEDFDESNYNASDIATQIRDYYEKVKAFVEA